MVPSQHSVLKGAFEWVVVVAIALVATFAIRSFVVEPFVVPTGSMESTIEIGDQILAQKVTLELGQPVKQGDIVVFHNPDATSEHDVLVKRAMPRPARRSTCRTARSSSTAGRSTRTIRLA